jgi:hypothetical protein
VKAVRFDARLVRDGEGWVIDFMRAEPETPDTDRRDCKGAARAMAAKIATGSTPSIPADTRGACGAWNVDEGPKSVCNAPIAGFVAACETVPDVIGCHLCAEHVARVMARAPEAVIVVYPSGDCADPELAEENRAAILEARARLQPARPFWQLQAESAVFAVSGPPTPEDRRELARLARHLRYADLL